MKRLCTNFPRGAKCAILTKNRDTGGRTMRRRNGKGRGQPRRGTGRGPAGPRLTRRALLWGGGAAALAAGLWLRSCGGLRWPSRPGRPSEPEGPAAPAARRVAGGLDQLHRIAGDGLQLGGGVSGRSRRDDGKLRRPGPEHRSCAGAALWGRDLPQRALPLEPYLHRHPGGEPRL